MNRVALLMVLVVMSACGHRRVATVAGPGMNTKREAALLDQAAAALQCDERGLIGAFEGSLEANYHSYRVDGCGKRFHALLHCTGICNWRTAPETLAEKALNCPATQLSRQYTPMNHVFTIVGCGQTIQYELGQGHLSPLNTAAANPTAPAPVAPTSTTPYQPPPPPPPPPPGR